jgi:hypothetical protein
MEFYNYNDNVDKLNANEIFIIHKGNRKARWKIIQHPYFDAYALVKDHRYLNNDNFMNEDINHIVSGAETIKKVYQQAYDHT